MIILDRPYVSDLLAETLQRLRTPVLRNSVSEDLAEKYDLELVDGEEFAKRANKEKYPLIYTSSEDAIGWIAENLEPSGLPARIDLLKNKINFRSMIEEDHPGFFYAGIDLEALRHLDPSGLPKPFVVKPAVGFFSVAVRKVESDSDWPAALKSIEEDLESFGGMYPGQVFDPGKFIIEEGIKGEEFAIDVYYDGTGRPVILNVLHHLFTSGTDVSDTTYVTSKGIVEYGIQMFTGPLARIGKQADLKNFPIHIEMRVDGRDIVPVEANPMRFAGFGGTDFGWYAWGINTHEYFLERKIPDWNTIFSGKEDKVYSMYVAFIPEDVPVSSVKEIDYEGFVSNFTKVLELRKTDWRNYRVFSFVFTETGPETASEIERNLQLDLAPYVVLKA
jgi:hypothetical protein